jgi:hypothetical protein
MIKVKLGYGEDQQRIIYASIQLQRDDVSLYDNYGIREGTRLILLHLLRGC